MAIGLLLAFDMPLRQLLAPVTSAGKAVTSTLNDARTRPAVAGPGTPVGPGKAVRRPTDGRGRAAKGAAIVGRVAPPPGQTGIWGDDATPQRSDIPAAVPSPIPTSATFAPARAGGAAVQTPVRALDVGLRPLRDPDDVTDASDSPPTRERIEYILPRDRRSSTTSPSRSRPAATRPPHQRNEEIIVKKLAGFGIPAQIVGRATPGRS